MWTPGQAAVVRVQPGHMTRAVAAGRRTLALLLLPSGGIWKRDISQSEGAVPVLSHQGVGGTEEHRRWWRFCVELK